MAVESQQREFAKELGLKETITIAVGAMIGGGIFTVLGRLAGLAGPLAIFSFLLGGIISFLTAHSYIKLVSKYPSAGGEFVILRRGFSNQLFGNTVGALLWLGYSVTIALYAFTFGLYISEWFVEFSKNLGFFIPLVNFFSSIGFEHFFEPSNLDIFTLRRVMAAFAILLFLAINLRGVKETGTIQNIIVSFKLMVLIFVALFGLFFISGQRYIDSWARAVETSGSELFTVFNGIFVGGAIIFVSYEGFQVIANTVEELKNPSRDVKVGMYLSVIVVCITYIAVTFVTIGLTDPDPITGKIDEAALIHAVEGVKITQEIAILGAAAVTIITLGAIASTTSAINATLLGSSRLAYVMSEWSAFPRRLAKISKKSKVPYLALIITSLISLGFTFLGKADSIAEVASIIFLGIFLCINIAAVVVYPYERNWVSKIAILLIVIDIILAFYYLIFVEGEEASGLTFIVLTILIVVTIIWMIGNQKLTKEKGVDLEAYKLAPLGTDLIEEFHYSDTSDQFFVDMDHILLPVSGKSYETQNLLVTAYLARKYRVKVTLLHVGKNGRNGKDGENGKAFKTAESIFRDFKVEYDTINRSGNHVDQQIVDVYNNGDYQLISLSSRRKHGLVTRLFEKSISANVVKNVSCSVLQVHPPRYGQKDREIGDLFMLLDGSERDSYLTRWAQLISSIGIRSKISAYHILQLPDIFPLDEALNVPSIQNSKARFERYSIDLSRRVALDVQPRFMYGHSIVNTIAGETKISEPDAIIMGHTKDKGLRYRLRTPLAYRIMNKVDCAVIVHHMPELDNY